MNITTIILTLNEEKHLARCIDSVQKISSKIIVIDSYSTDATLTIAREKGAQVLQNKWINYATQFNWALTQLDLDTKWILRIDADEILTPTLLEEISSRLPFLNTEIAGVYFGRRMTFQGHLIKHGGVFPVRVLRLFRLGQGHCENRWMDEHIKVKGTTLDFKGEIIDDNLNNLTWWTNKHNQYASREAIDLLNLEYCFMPHDTVANLRVRKQAEVKRWIKESIYSRLPVGLRAFAYFFYRYVLRLGYLDGQAGTAFHFLQGFWYRYLVDSKVSEVKRYIREKDVGIVEAIESILEIQIPHDQKKL